MDGRFLDGYKETNPQANKQTKIDLSHPVTSRVFIEQNLIFVLVGELAKIKHLISADFWNDFDYVLKQLKLSKLQIDLTEMGNDYDLEGLRKKLGILDGTTVSFDRCIFYQNFWSYKVQHETYKRFIILNCYQFINDKKVWKLVKTIASALLKIDALTREEIVAIAHKQTFYQQIFVNKFAGFHFKALQMLRKDRAFCDELMLSA